MNSKAVTAFIEPAVPQRTAHFYHTMPYPYNETFEKSRHVEVELIRKCAALNRNYKVLVKRRNKAYERISTNLGRSPWLNSKAAFTEYEKLDGRLKMVVGRLEGEVLDLQLETSTRRAVAAEVLWKAWQQRTATVYEQDVLNNYTQEQEYEVDFDALYDRRAQKADQGPDLGESPADDIFKVFGNEPRGLVGTMVHWLVVTIWKLLVAIVHRWLG